MAVKTAATDNPTGMSDGMRSMISLIILIHLFCVITSLLGNESSSELRNRLASVLGPYTRLLNLDPDFTAGLHLTHAMEYEDDHQLVIELEGVDTTRLFPTPADRRTGLPSGFRTQRWQWLAKRLGILASDGDDDAVAELARAIGEAVIDDRNVPRLVLRVRRLRPSELDADINYTVSDEATYETLYSADVFTDSQGSVRIHKKIQSDEAAPVVAD